MKLRRLSVVILFVLSGQLLFSQSKSEIIEYGDNAYKNENYASAAFFYLKIIEKKGVSSGLVHPYEARTWVAPSKQDKTKKDSLKATEKTDTNLFKGNNVVLHKLASSYFKSRDYKKAEKWYEIAVNYSVDEVDEAFVDIQSSRLWYAESLMKNEKYEEASIQFEEFKKETPNMDLSKRADKGIIGCFFAQDGSSNNPSASITLADSNLNFGTSSYGVNYFGDEKKQTEKGS